MAEKYFWVGTNGPYPYDDTDTYPDDGDDVVAVIVGETVRPFFTDGVPRTEQIFLNSAASDAENAIRYGDLSDILDERILEPIEVANITQCVELNDLAGPNPGSVIFVCEPNETGHDEFAIYAWDEDPDVVLEDPPYYVDGSGGGRWVAVGGKWAYTLSVGGYFVANGEAEFVDAVYFHAGTVWEADASEPPTVVGTLDTSGNMWLAGTLGVEGTVTLTGDINCDNLTATDTVSGNTVAATTTLTVGGDTVVTSTEFGLHTGDAEAHHDKVTLVNNGYGFVSIGADPSQVLTLSQVDLASEVTGTLDESNIDSDIARDSEVTSAISSHAGDDDAHHSPVTLDTTSYNYLSLSTQEIVLGPIDLATDVTGVLPSGNLDSHVTYDNVAEQINAAWMFNDTVLVNDAASDATLHIQGYDGASSILDMSCLNDLAFTGLIYSDNIPAILSAQVGGTQYFAIDSSQYVQISGVDLKVDNNIQCDGYYTGYGGADVVFQLSHDSYDFSWKDSGGSELAALSSSGVLLLNGELDIDGTGDSAFAGDITVPHVWFPAAYGERISLLGDRFGLVTAYGFGTESGPALYSKVYTGGYHRWYIGANADGGTSAHMTLGTTGLTLANNLTLGGEIDQNGSGDNVFSGDLDVPHVHFPNTEGDKISLYDDRIGATNMYGLGMETTGSTALYFKTGSGTKYRWYIGANADGGTSDVMELSTSGLAVNVPSGTEGANVFYSNGTSNCQVKIDSAGSANFVADRGGYGNYSGYWMRHAGSNKWFIGMPYNGGASNTRFIIGEGGGGTGDAAMTIDSGAKTVTFHDDITHEAEVLGTRHTLTASWSGSSSSTVYAYMNQLQMDNAGRGFVMSRAGSIVGCGWYINLTSGAGASDIWVDIYRRSGSTNTLLWTVGPGMGSPAPPGVNLYTETAARDTYQFSAGDILFATISASGNTMDAATITIDIHLDT